MLIIAYLHLCDQQAQAPSLLDMAFDNVGMGVNNLPPADYLPALEKQRELEAQVLKQQVCLKYDILFSLSAQVFNGARYLY